MSAAAVPFEEVLLERMTLAYQQRLSPELAANTDARVIGDLVGGDLTAQLYTYVMADKRLTEDREVPFSGSTQVELPPRRLRDRLAFIFGRRERITVPVYGTVTVTAKHFATFPESTVRFPESLGRMVALTQTDAHLADLHEGYGGE